MGVEMEEGSGDMKEELGTAEERHENETRSQKEASYIVWATKTRPSLCYTLSMRPTATEGMILDSILLLTDHQLIRLLSPRSPTTTAPPHFTCTNTIHTVLTPISLTGIFKSIDIGLRSCRSMPSMPSMLLHLLGTE